MLRCGRYSLKEIMRKVTLGLIQMSCGTNKEENLQKGIVRLRECAQKGANIVAFSELFAGPYFCQIKDKKFFDLAEKIPGPITEILQKEARELGIAIVTSIYEKADDGKLYNTAVVIDADGTYLGKYRKMHIPADELNGYMEDFYFAPGDMGFKVFETKFGKVAPMICYDQWFPEGARIAATKGAEILFYPTAIGWPLADRPEKARLDKAENDAWITIQRSHSIANNIFVASINRVGTEEGLNFWGNSFVSNPYGEILGKASNDKEENIIVECDLDIIEVMRREWPFLKERRVQCEKFES